jgi:hypothetical protein
MTENQSTDETHESNKQDDESILNLNEGVGQFDDTAAEEEQFTTTDPGWGSESAESLDDSNGTTRQSAQQEPSDMTSADEGDAPTNLDNPINGMSVHDLTQQAEGQTLSFNLKDASVPGTNYERMKYVYKRMGKKKTEYDRPKKLRLNVFEETGGQIEIIYERFEEEIYPNVNVLKADVLEAALLVGVYNPDQMKVIMDEWGYAEMNES